MVQNKEKSILSMQVVMSRWNEKIAKIKKDFPEIAGLIAASALDQDEQEDHLIFLPVLSAAQLEQFKKALTTYNAKAKKATEFEQIQAQELSEKMNLLIKQELQTTMREVEKISQEEDKNEEKILLQQLEAA